MDIVEFSQSSQAVEKCQFSFINQIELLKMSLEFQIFFLISDNSFNAFNLSKMSVEIFSIMSSI